MTMNGIFTLVTPYVYAIGAAKPGYFTGVALLTTNTAYQMGFHQGGSRKFQYGYRSECVAAHPIATPVFDWFNCY